MNYCTIAPTSLRQWIGLLLFCSLVGFSNDLFADHVYRAMLRGRHEVMPVATPAFGDITATLNGNVLTIEGRFSGLTGDFASNVAGGSHIHLGYAGQNGGIQIRLVADLDEDLRGGAYEAADNTFELTDEQLAALSERRLYINVHSTLYPGGEIRGQLLPQADEYFYVNLLGSNEVPAVMSRGSGALALELTGSELIVSGSFQNLSSPLAVAVAGGAHLHLGFAGQNGPIRVPIASTTAADGRSGVFTVADNTVDVRQLNLKHDLELRRIYANVHSEVFRGGELRGQVLGIARSVFRAHLSGSNENPAVTSLATGVVLSELMPDGRLITSGSFAGLESKMAINTAGGAHIHRGMSGQNGPVMFRIFVTPRGDLRSAAVWGNRNVANLSDAQVTTLYNRGMYANVHSLENGSGEIRGQLLPESQMVFSGFLSGTFEPGGVVSTGAGGVKAELSGTRLVVSGSFRGLSTPVAVAVAGGAHIHRGMAGSNGPITQPLNITLGQDMTSGVFEAAGNIFTLTEDDIAEFLARSKYVNIHSERVRSGEIRSQLLPEASAYFVAPLSGASETNLVNTAAGGMTILEVTGTRGILSGSFSNLSSPVAVAIAGGAHIHSRALAGENAGVRFPLNSVLNADMMGGTFPAAANVLTLDEDFISALRDRATYTNIHTDQNRPGEIRGQLLPLATAYFSAVLSGMNEIQPKATAGRGQVKAELHGNHLVVSGAFSGLTGNFATAIAGGSHLHAAMAGANGGIQIFTNAELNADQKSGRYNAEDNTFELSAGNLADLLSANLYFNIHSTTFNPGEIRGQVLPEPNAFPSAGASIQSPVSGSSVEVVADPGREFTVEWSAAADRDPLAYIWQLSDGDAFDNLLVNQNVGKNLFFTTDMATLDALLAAAGIAPGESAMLFHRAVASDGSIFTPGPTASVMVTRSVDGAGGARLGQAPAQLQSVTTFQVFPTVIQNRQNLKVQVNADLDRQSTLVLVDGLGRVIQRLNIDLFQGDNRLEWALPELAAGFYFVQLQIEGSLLPLQRIVVN